MTARLRHRAAHALRRAPRSFVALVALYLAERARATRGLARRGLDEVVERIDGRGARTRIVPDLASAELAIEVAEALCARTPAADTCLFRALARYALLRRLGLEPVLVVGVRPGSALDAPAPASDDEIGHAWVELAGEPFPPERLPRLVVSYRHPRSRPLDRATADVRA